MIITVAVLGHGSMMTYVICRYMQLYKPMRHIYNIWVYVEVVFTIQDVVLATVYLFHLRNYLYDVSPNPRASMVR
jgi:hypothetical protein